MQQHDIWFYFFRLCTGIGFCCICIGFAVTCVFISAFLRFRFYQKKKHSELMDYAHGSVSSFEEPTERRSPQCRETNTLKDQVFEINYN